MTVVTMTNEAKPTTVPCPHCGGPINPHVLVGKLTAAKMTPEQRKQRARRAHAAKAKKKADRNYEAHRNGGQFT